MQEAPSDIKLNRELRILSLTWRDGSVTHYPLRLLRQTCRCASCVHEFTGAQILDPDSVPEDIEVTKISLVGNYAVSIGFSDDHDTGIYSWKHLAMIRAQAEV